MLPHWKGRDDLADTAPPEDSGAVGMCGHKIRLSRGRFMKATSEERRGAGEGGDRSGVGGDNVTVAQQAVVG